MAYNKTYDEKNPDELTNTTAGTNDAPNSVIEWQWQILPSYVIAQKNSSNDVAYGFTHTNDVDVYSLGELSTGFYKADVDSFNWDYSNMTFGSISQFKIL